ncbi:MAG: Tol-Pal system beta propeller repeat protein TolB [Lysobacterales bacterium]
MQHAMSRALVLILLLVGAAAQAQTLSIDIPEGNPSARPIAVVPFAYEGGGLPLDTDLAEVISGDLNRSGQFKALGRDDIIEYPVRGSEVKYPTWRLLKQDHLLIGRVLDVDQGVLRIEFELHDIVTGQRLLGLALSSRRGDLRGAGHQIADFVYEKITGVRGAFWTRMAYVTSTGVGRNTQYALMVADSDGFNPQVVVRSQEPLMSPAWSPDSKKLAYVSFERGSSTVYQQELTTGNRQVLASFRGINGAPAFSPDGSRLAMTLSQSGNPEIYVMNLSDRSLTQLTRHYAIDTEPVWTADGSRILFTSDRAGKPQIYQVAASGGEATRITFQGEYNARATLYASDQKIAMAQGSGNVYRIALLDRSRGGAEVTLLSPGNLDESPSFAPNGSMLLYAAREGQRGVLYAVSADGRVRQRLVLADGDVREPAWSPFRQR